ncbi:hypothetical protein PUN28_002234 [Cardiocondyla obscurior]|uniref:Uncharacterized protein n=1 Tax=Cardiocondyla obscurior TaxID=286306 RepID=A0AAW2GSY3_9HYME
MGYTVEQLNKNPWLAVQDVIGDARTWPKFIREIFWNKNFKNHNRMIVVNFAYLNAISEDFLHDILKFTLKSAYTNERRRNVKDRNLDEVDVVVFIATAFTSKKC